MQILIAALVILLKTGNNPDVHRMNYSVIRRNKGLTDLQQHGWISETLSLVREASWRRPHTVWFHFYDIPEKAKLEGQVWDQRLTESRRAWLQDFCRERNCSTWFLVGVSQLYVFIRIPRTVHFAVCKLYFNKSDSSTRTDNNTKCGQRCITIVIFIHCRGQCK